jgi:hypothetical protein
MDRAFLDYYRCPEGFATFTSRELPSGRSGYFQFGPKVVCYGRCSSALPATHVTDALHDTLEDVTVHDSIVCLPFTPSEIAANLRCERYLSSYGDASLQPASYILREVYYTVRPLLSVSVRKHLQRMHLRDWEEIRFPNWPVDTSVECMFKQLMRLSLEAHGVPSVPFIWFWPEGLPGCAIMTHDVETSAGRDLCSRLMDVDEAYGIKSSFEIVPEGRYAVSQRFLNNIRDRGFEINVHDLDHDGRLFSDRELFLSRAERINRYRREFGADGFRSAILYRNVDWFSALDFAYDMSVPNAASLEAQRGGCCSVTPYFINNVLEVPVTTTQDYGLFHILNDYSIDLWKRQMSLIADQDGLASFIIHPDYIFERRALDAYRALLTYLADLRYQEKIWIARPREVNDWWRDRSQMRLVDRGEGWEIEGPGKERARIAYASADGDRLVYRVESSPASTVKTVNAA